MRKPLFERTINLTSNNNPYTPPNDTCSSSSSRILNRRLVFLLLPPLIPLVVHAVVRVFIPSNETLYHGLFTLGAIIPAWIWGMTMVDRLRLSLWRSYLVTCYVWGAVVTSSLLSPPIVDWITSLP